MRLCQKVETPTAAILCAAPPPPATAWSIAWKAPREPDPPVTAWTRRLLKLPPASGERFPQEWKIVARRIEVVHTLPVSRDTEPAGAPRLQPLLDARLNPVPSPRRRRSSDE